MKRSAGVGAGWEEGREGVEGKKSAHDRIIQLPRLNSVQHGWRRSVFDKRGENGSERARSRGASGRVRKAAWRKNYKHVSLLHSLSGGELW